MRPYSFISNYLQSSGWELARSDPIDLPAVFKPSEIERRNRPPIIEESLPSLFTKKPAKKPIKDWFFNGK